MHSALHVGGRRLYEYARQGVEVLREPRSIEIFELKRLELEGNKLVASVRCSKGTYVRVLAADIGRALGCGAYLTALRRTQVGPFSVQSAVASAELEARGEAWGRARLLPVPALVSELGRLDASSEQAARFRHGRDIEAAGYSAGQPVAIFGSDGEFLGVAQAREDGWLAPLRLMAEQGEIA
jgi:tRNA pseudouridine55 synthase